MPNSLGPMDYTVHGILQARILEWVAFPFSKGSSQPGIEPRSSTLQADSLPAKAEGKPKNIGVGRLSLLQWIFLTREWNRVHLHYKQILYQLNYQGSPDGKFLFLFFIYFYFYWRLITSQYCDGFCHTFTESAMGVHVSSHGCTSWLSLAPPTPSHPSGSFSAPALITLSHASSLEWQSISHIIYMFQYYSDKSSHPRLLPQSPKVCSLYLCIFCCLEYRVIVTIFLNSIYMRYSNVLVIFFLTYFTLYNRLQFHPSH